MPTLEVFQLNPSKDTLPPKNNNNKSRNKNSFTGDWSHCLNMQLILFPVNIRTDDFIIVCKLRGWIWKFPNHDRTNKISFWKAQILTHKAHVERKRHNLRICGFHERGWKMHLQHPDAFWLRFQCRVYYTHSQQPLHSRLPLIEWLNPPYFLSLKYDFGETQSITYRPLALHRHPWLF